VLLLSLPLFFRLGAGERAQKASPVNAQLLIVTCLQEAAAAQQLTCARRRGIEPSTWIAELNHTMLVYLSGSIEFAADGGRAWRRQLTPFLQQILGHRVYDPAEDEKKSLSEEEAAHFRAWKTTDPERFRRTVRKIINWDLDLIEKQADYLICFWDGASARGAGTQAELTAAYRRGIPVYLVTELPASEISGWVLGCAEQVFGSFEELKAFLLATFGGKATQ
jgi:hypothetical protein